MKRRTIVIVAALVVLLVVITSAPFAASALAGDAQKDAGLQDNLAKQGIETTSVTMEEGMLEVELQSDEGGTPNDPWARTLAIREAAFLADAGTLQADLLGITMRSTDGDVVYRYEGPIEATARPTCKDALPAGLESEKADLQQKATEHRVQIDDISLTTDSNQGIIIEVKSTLEQDVSLMEQGELRWATVELLGELKSLRKASGEPEADLHRFTVASKEGDTLISYVVEPKARITRAWLAPGITPFWR